MKRLFLAPVFIFLLFASCAKESGTVYPYGSVTINVSHFIELKPYYIDTTNNHTPPPTELKPLVFDTLIYQNAYREQYSVSKLEYYLSNIQFYNGNNLIYVSDKVFYIDARNPVTKIHIDGVPVGNYTAVSYEIGLDATKNYQGYLPNTAENVNMEWPSSMGGGYHFLKMEGYWKNKTTQKINSGYAMHLGSNSSLAWGISHPTSMHIKSGTNNLCFFKMNVSEWWKSPNLYSIELNGNYTMGDQSLMNLIRDNAIDIFDVYQ